MDAVATVSVVSFIVPNSGGKCRVGYQEYYQHPESHRQLLMQARSVSGSRTTCNPIQHATLPDLTASQQFQNSWLIPPAQ